MTVNISRSPNTSFDDGATDGKYRKVRPNWTVDDPTMGADLTKAERAALHPFYNYGFIETETTNKVVPNKTTGTASTPPSPMPVFDLDSVMTPQEN